MYSVQRLSTTAYCHLDLEHWNTIYSTLIVPSVVVVVVVVIVLVL